jgi:PhnB protein
MATINPYLNLPGTTEEAFNFYKSVFGGEFLAVIRFKDSPGGSENVAEADKDKLTHIALPIGKNILMATDSIGEMGMGYKQGNNYHVSINADSKEEAETIFAALSAGGQVIVPLAMAEWGDLFGWFTDKFGISWMVSYSPNRPQ